MYSVLLLPINLNCKAVEAAGHEGILFAYLRLRTLEMTNC